MHEFQLFFWRQVAFGMDLNITLDDNSPFKEAVSKCLEGADKGSRDPWVMVREPAATYCLVRSDYSLESPRDCV